MKLPKYFIETMQDALNVGFNAFALQLLAESFSDNIEKFGDENIVVLMHDHQKRDVWMILTKKMPVKEDFE